MIRSLYEHRVARDPKHRTVINEAGPLMRLLYLNNNYHLVHRVLPHLPWYQLPYAYRIRRDRGHLARNFQLIQPAYSRVDTRVEETAKVSEFNGYSRKRS